MKMTRIQPIIGITGKAGSGKDTLAAHLELNYGYKRLAFADPIRRGLMAMLNIKAHDFEHPRKEQSLYAIGKSPRQLMQTLGTEWGRNQVHPDLWLILAQETIELSLLAGVRVVVTDVRFENEAQLVRDMGGAVWHMTRQSAGTPHEHASEAGVAFKAGKDVLVRNDGTVCDMYAYADGVLA